MTVAMWILSSVLVMVVTLVVMGAAIRPYVQDLVTDRAAWQKRAELAEAEIEAHLGNEVRLVNPTQDTIDDLDGVFFCIQ